VAKELILMAKSQMVESLQTLSETISIFDKRCGLKIVGKPCEGKPHARFDEGLLGRLKAAPAAYSTVSYDFLLNSMISPLQSFFM
jgi:hypothetical protein